VLLAEPVGELVGTEAVGSVHPHEDEPLVGVVERQLDRHAVDVTAGLPGEPVQERVDVVALFEHASGRVQGVDLAHGPAVPQVVVAVEDVVDGHIGAAAGSPVMAEGSGSRMAFRSVVATNLRPAKLYGPIMQPA